MVRKKIRDTMVKQPKHERKPPENDYLTWEEIKKGESYYEESLGNVEVRHKTETIVGDRIIHIRMFGESYAYPEKFTNLKLKRRKNNGKR